MARRHGVADQVGDRVRFSRSRRPLDDETVRLRDPSHDLDLVAVELLRKEHVAEADLRLARRFARLRSADDRAQRQPPVVADCLRRLGDDALRHAADGGLLVLGAAPKAVDVLQHHVLRAGPREENPTVGDSQVFWVRLGRRLERRSVLGVGIKACGRGRQDGLERLARERGNALVLRRDLYLASDEIGKARESRAAEFFVRFQVEEGIGGGRSNADEAAARVVEFDLDPPFDQRPVEQLAALLPVGRANAPHEFDRTLRGSDLEKLENLVQLLIELDRSSSRNLFGRPLRPRARDPLVDRLRSVGSVLQPKFQIETRRRVLRLAALARSLEDVVGPHFRLRQGLVPPSRVDRHQAMWPRFGNLFRVGGQDNPLGQVFWRARGLLARESFDLQPDLAASSSRMSCLTPGRFSVSDFVMANVEPSDSRYSES